MELTGSGFPIRKRVYVESNKIIFYFTFKQSKELSRLEEDFFISVAYTDAYRKCRELLSALFSVCIRTLQKSVE